MSRKPINIPAEPDTRHSRVTPDLVRAERAALQVIVAYCLCFLLMLGVGVLFVWADGRWLPWTLGFTFLGFVAVSFAALIYLSRKS